MNVLVIDDQRQVVDSICAGLHWDELGVQHVYGAYSAKEAIRLGSVDYILQPARFEEIEAGLRKHVEARAERLYLKELKKRQKVLKEKEYVLIDQTFEKMLNEGLLTAEEQGFQIQNLCHKQYQNACFYLFSIQILRWTNQQWSSQLVRMVLGNVIGELFESCECEVLLGGFSDNEYAVVLHGDRSSMTEKIILSNVQTMYEFIQEKMTFQIAVYLGGFIESIHQGLEELCCLMKDNVLQKTQIFSIENKKTVPIHLEQLHTERWGNLLEEGNWRFV